MIWKQDLGFIDITGRGPQKKAKPRIGPVYERCLLYLGVILPTLALAFEMQFHVCARFFFDPFPSTAHTFLFAMIPLANLLAWMSLWRNMNSQLGLALFANGMALGIALLYSLMFLPVLPTASLWILALGIGLLAFAPSIALIVLHFSGNKVASFAHGMDTFFNPHQVKHAGHLLILAIVLAVELPSTITRVALGMANNAETARQGLDILRTFGNQEVMLRACYERSGRATDILGSLYESKHPVNVEDMRRIFYKATGRTYNSFPIPESARATMNHMGTLAYDGIDNGADDEFDADPDIAGEMVSGVSRGLSVAQSKIQGKVDADAGVGQLDWFLDFKNVSKYDREVRTRISLPHGAAVNKASLIVDGKEYECDITLKEEAREIYRAAVENKQNPLLVSLSGEDTVLVQCYPVPPGEKLQMHLGIVSPLMLDRDKQAVLTLPQFEERNFQINVPHALKLSSNHEISVPWGQMKLEHPDNNTYTMTGSIEASQVASGGGIIQLKRDSLKNKFYCKDDFVRNGRCANRSQPGNAITASAVVDLKMDKPSELEVVIDCSENMKEYYAGILETLRKLPDSVKKTRITCVTDSGDQTFEWAGSANNDSISQMSKINCVGGQMDGRALCSALNRIMYHPKKALLWIHGAQPLNTPEIDALKARLQNRSNRIYDMQITSGTNQYLDGITNPRISKIARFGKPQDDLKLFFEQMENPGLLKTFKYTSNYDINLPRSFEPEQVPQAINPEMPVACIEDVQVCPAELSPQNPACAPCKPAELISLPDQVSAPAIGRCIMQSQQVVDDSPAEEFAPAEDRKSSLIDIKACTETMHQLAQLWAYDRIKQMILIGQDWQAHELAGRYHLVTPVSSAVLTDTVPDLYRLSCPQPVLEHYNTYAAPNISFGPYVYLQGEIDRSFKRLVKQMNRLDPTKTCGQVISCDGPVSSMVAGQDGVSSSDAYEGESDPGTGVGYGNIGGEISVAEGSGGGSGGGGASGCAPAEFAEADMGYVDEVAPSRSYATDKIAYAHAKRKSGAKLDAASGSRQKQQKQQLMSPMPTPTPMPPTPMPVPMTSAPRPACGPVPVAAMAPPLPEQEKSQDYDAQCAMPPAVSDYKGRNEPVAQPAYPAAPAECKKESFRQQNYSGYSNCEDAGSGTVSSRSSYAQSTQNLPQTCEERCVKPSGSQAEISCMTAEEHYGKDNCDNRCATNYDDDYNGKRDSDILNEFGQPDFFLVLKKYWFSVLGLFFLVYSIVHISLRKIGLSKD